MPSVSPVDIIACVSVFFAVMTLVCSAIQTLTMLWCMVCCGDNKRLNIYRVLCLITKHNKILLTIYRIMSQTRNVCSQQVWMRVAFHAGHLVLWVSEKARRVVDDVRVVAV